MRSVMRSAGSLLIGSPVNCADRVIGSPIAWRYTGRAGTAPQALQCLVAILRSLVEWYQVTSANAALAAAALVTAAAAAVENAEGDDQLLDADPKPAPAGAGEALECWGWPSVWAWSRMVKLCAWVWA